MSSSPARRLAAVLIVAGASWAVARAQAVTGNLTIAWDANVTDPDLAGYRAYAVTDPNILNLSPAAARPLARTMDVAKTALTTTFANLDATKVWYFKVTSLDTSGNESVFSSPVVSAQPPITPIVRTVTPSSAIEGQSGVTVTIGGQNFLSTSTVSFGSGITVTALNTSGVPATLVATINVGTLAQVSARDVVVTNSASATGTKTGAFSVLFNAARADINKSGAVDGADFVDLLLGFPSFLGDAYYNTNRDLNVDGKVDGSDFAIFFSLF
jgi:hypothetical protein